MNTATATIITIFAATLTLVTVLVYDRIVRDLRYQVEIARDHADQCQALMATMRAHPSGKRISPDLALIKGSAS